MLRKTLTLHHFLTAATSCWKFCNSESDPVPLIDGMLCIDEVYRIVGKKRTDDKTEVKRVEPGRTGYWL